MTREEALAKIAEFTGKQFDPAIVRVFRKIIDELQARETAAAGGSVGVPPRSGDDGRRGGRMKRQAGVLILLLAAVAFFPSCAGTNKAAVRQAGAESEQLLRDARYQKAVEVYRAALREHPGDKAIAADYVRTVTRVHDAAGIAMNNGDFAAAERIYLLLMKNAPDYERLSSAPAFTRVSLESELKACRIAAAKKHGPPESRNQESSERRFVPAGESSSLIPRIPAWRPIMSSRSKASGPRGRAPSPRRTSPWRAGLFMP